MLPTGTIRRRGRLPGDGSPPRRAERRTGHNNMHRYGARYRHRHLALIELKP